MSTSRPATQFPTHERSSSSRFVGTVCDQRARLRFLVTGHGSRVKGFIDGTYVVLDTGRDAGQVVGEGTFTGVPGTAGEYLGTTDC